MWITHEIPFTLTLWSGKDRSVARSRDLAIRIEEGPCYDVVVSIYEATFEEFRSIMQACRYIYSLELLTTRAKYVNNERTAIMLKDLWGAQTQGLNPWSPNDFNGS